MRPSGYAHPEATLLLEHAPGNQNSRIPFSMAPSPLSGLAWASSQGPSSWGRTHPHACLSKPLVDVCKVLGWNWGLHTAMSSSRCSQSLGCEERGRKAGWVPQVGAAACSPCPDSLELKGVRLLDYKGILAKVGDRTDFLKQSWAWFRIWISIFYCIWMSLGRCGKLIGLNRVLVFKGVPGLVLRLTRHC